jgi:hypothetical protein
VLQTFFVDDDLQEAFQLDALITVVDAKHILQHLDEEKPDGVENESGGCLISGICSWQLYWLASHARRCRMISYGLRVLGPTTGRRGKASQVGVLSAGSCTVKAAAPR